jgi:hypothetical protein
MKMPSDSANGAATLDKPTDKEKPIYANSKVKKTAALITTGPAPEPTLPTLAELTKMKETDRIGLYKKCDAELRSRFLIQGKVLHTLGEAGEDLLKKAGIPSSSLSNARYAAMALALTSPKLDMIIHNGKKPVSFSEEIYDSLTFEQCQLLAYATSFRGTARVVKYRPDFSTVKNLLKMKDWDDEIECFFANGKTRSALKAHAAEQERLLAEQKAATEAALVAAQATTASANALPAAPVIIRGPVATEEVEETEETEEVGAPVVGAPEVSAPEATPTGHEDEDEQDQEDGQEQETEAPASSIQHPASSIQHPASSPTNIVAFTPPAPAAVVESVPCGTSADVSGSPTRFTHDLLMSSLGAVSKAIGRLEDVTPDQIAEAQQAVEGIASQLKALAKAAKKAAA